MTTRWSSLRQAVIQLKTGSRIARIAPSGMAIVVTVVAVAAAFAASFAVAPYPITQIGAIREAWRASDAWLVDRHGAPLSRVRIDHERRRGEWVRVDDVSPALTQMIIASEDRRFHEHRGVDVLAMSNALKQTLGGGRRGGSTLTMQLAAYLNPELEKSGRRSVVAKWRQLRQALAIERAWSKNEILEAWLNLTPFRGEVEGVDAAARTLFGKHAQGLDRVESALLAALVRAPNAGASRVARRACGVLHSVEQHMGENSPSPYPSPTPGRGVTNASASQSGHPRVRENDGLLAQGLAAGGLRPRSIDTDLDGAAPHLARKLLKRAGERVSASIDARVQRFAVSSLQRHIRELAGRNVEDGALVVLDNETGEVLAWIGSSGEMSGARDVDGVLAPRLAGSTLKPFLYALALEQRLLTAASLLDDSPLAVTLPTGLYVPQNYDRAFKGHVSLRQALASSLNVPAVRTLALLGYEPFYRKLKSLGFETLRRDADHYGYSLALGGAEVTLLQLTNAYRALSNDGAVDAVHFLKAKADERSGATRILDPRAAYIVGDILSDPAARALTFGFASPLATRYRSAVKTGTSKDMRDNWAVGFAGRYTVGVWVGNFSGAPMHDVSGIDGAAPIWREVMDMLQEGAAPDERQPPGGIVRSRVSYAGALEPARDEWFIAGTERSSIVALPSRSVRPHIESPAPGTIYAIDPDVPRERQRLVVAASGAPRGARFVFEDGRQARADRPLMWLPSPGKRELILVNAQGKELDRVRFEVRGLRPSTRTPAIP